MNSKTFIDRPILSGVISVFIVILGLIGLYRLPIEQFPEIAPPTVRISTTYAGADAETVQKAVIAPLEEAINGVENVNYMTSSATNNGAAVITIYFRQGTNPDMAAVNVQNRIASVQGSLPPEVIQTGIMVKKSQNSTTKIIALYSPDDSYDQKFLYNYFKINIYPQLARIKGVGDISLFGSEYSLRIWMDPIKMSQHGLVPSDITAILDEQNIEAPTGTLGADADNTFQYTLKYRGRLEREEDFENLVIKSLPDGNILRLKDIADVELGILDYSVKNELIGHPGTNCMIAQASGSNAYEIVKDIDKIVREISYKLPAGMKIVDLMSIKSFLDASIKNVAKTLFEAIVLVVLIVYAFLQNLRSTMIPSIAIIVSLTGTFAFLYFAGFSLNMLTLFALVLIIGTVVDDAIVVVEAVQAKLDDKYESAHQASVDAMKEIGPALITTSTVFMAVFIPVCFLDGASGTFFTHFGLTMATAVFISTINAMTLSPALCAMLLKPTTGQEKKSPTMSERFRISFDTAFGLTAAKYKRGLAFFFKRKWIALSLLPIALSAFLFLLTDTKTGLVPDEDTGTVVVDVQTAPGSSLTRTGKVMNDIEDRIKDVPQFQIYSKSVGMGMLAGQNPSAGTFIIRLKPWGQRSGKGNDNKSVIAGIYDRLSDMKDARIMVFAQPIISGYGVTNGFEVHVQDRNGGSIEMLAEQTRRFIASLEERPEISRARTDFDAKYPQYMVEVDAAKCKRNGISPSDVLDVLSGYVGGYYSSDMNRFSKLYRVMIQASPEHRMDQRSLDNMFVRSATEEMSPITNYITLTRVYGAENLSRFNLFPSITVNGASAEGYSTGDAIRAIREVADQTLADGYGYEFGAMTREEASSQDSSIYVFLSCTVFVYLILCALYESLLIPLSVILSIPFGLAGSFLFAKLFGLENNIYMQTGIIMLIGLLSKTAILLSEYASRQTAKGMAAEAAAMSAARARLRPIIMTSLTMVFGLLPMIFSSGVGSNGARSLAAGTVGGMIIGTLALLFIVPTMFVVLHRRKNRNSSASLNTVCDNQSSTIITGNISH